MADTMPDPVAGRLAYLRSRHVQLLTLVIWRVHDGLGARWSFDALDLHQETGDLVPSAEGERRLRLRGALLGDGASHGLTETSSEDVEPATMADCSDVHVDWHMTPAKWQELRAVLTGDLDAADSPYIAHLKAEGMLRDA